ncbi:MAG: Wzz/FepE/Etk N-terminal domain-containing protein [Thermodesulforhabdaceae bacterium]
MEIASERKLTLRELVNVPFKFKKFILAVVGFSMIVAVVYCILARPVFNAEAKFIVKLGKERVAPLSVLPQAPYNVLLQETSQIVHDELEILKSHAVIYKMLPKFKEKLAEQTKKHVSFRDVVIKSVSFPWEVLKNIFQAVGILKKETEDEQLFKRIRSATKVSWQEDSNVIRIAFRWTDPETAAYGARLYAQAYLDLRNSIARSPQSLEFYEEQIKEHEDKLKKAEDELLAFQQQHTVAETSKQKEILLSEQERIIARMQDISLRLSEVEVKKNEVKRLLASGKDWIETPHIGSLGVQFTDLTTLDKKYFDLRNQLDGMLQIFTPKAREVQQVEEQIKELRKHKAESLIRLLNVEANNLREQYSKLQEDLEANKAKLNNLVQTELHYQQLLRNKKLLEENYLLYKKKAEEMRIMKEMDKWSIASVELIHDPIPPIDPIWPRKTLILVLTLFVSFVIGLVASFIKDAMGTTFERGSDLEEIGIRHIATIPEIEMLRKV